MGVLVVFVLIGAAAIASYTMSSQPEGEGRGIIQRVTRFIPLQSIKIVIVALQIVTQVRAVSSEQRLPGIMSRGRVLPTC